LESKETNKEKRGKIGLKASQLEDNMELESDFLEFITTLEVGE
jgi:hypothetical protein